MNEEEDYFSRFRYQRKTAIVDAFEVQSPSVFRMASAIGLIAGGNSAARKAKRTAVKMIWSKAGKIFRNNSISIRMP
jgi:hypothetical protein